MMRIKPLPVSLANQIAAGEVIERPASVVKELLENALDAEADSIHVDIAHGGLNQIRISDNGMGILAEDLPLAVMPHATSKIAKLADLFCVHTMGFRGEALASITSVAKVSIISRTRLEPHATSLTFDTENHPQLLPCARNPGTTIDVCDLFHNAPVRKKFLKTARQEFMMIESVVKRFAMSAPEVAIALTHDGKPVFSVPKACDSQSRIQRIAAIFGQSFMHESHYLETENGNMRLHGWISNAKLQRSQNDRIWVYVNNRMVKDKLIQHAIRSAYDNILYPGRFPSCLLYLNLPPEEVDVNVHPAKHELRFQEPRIVHDFLSSQLLHALEIKDTPKKPTEPAYKPKLQQYELRETAPTFHQADSWIILDKQYGMFMHERCPWMVDMLGLHERVILETLENRKDTWIFRPLLVPMYYAFPLKKVERANTIMDMLLKLGMQLNITEPGLFQIDSIPVMLPQLDIRQLFDKLFEDDDAMLFPLLSQCQFFDAFQLNPEEKMALSEAILDEDNAKRYARPLTAERLKEIFA